LIQKYPPFSSLLGVLPLTTKSEQLLQTTFENGVEISSGFKKITAAAAEM